MNYAWSLIYRPPGRTARRMLAADVARALAARADELAHDLHAAMAEASPSGSGVAALDDVHVDACTATVRSLLAAMATPDGFRSDIGSTCRCRSGSPKDGAVIANRVLSNRFPSALGCGGQ